MKCPVCKSKSIIPIGYGFPSPEIWEEVEKGNLKLGGCVISDDNPDMFCKDCEHEWKKECEHEWIEKE